MIQFAPTRAERQEIKRRCIVFLVENRLCSKAAARRLRRLQVDDLLDFFFERADAVALTLGDGRRITICDSRANHPGSECLQ